MAQKKIDLKYRKEDILLSRTLPYDIDILNVVLEEDKEYTLDEVEKLVEKFKKKVIN